MDITDYYKLFLRNCQVSGDLPGRAQLMYQSYSSPQNTDELIAKEAHYHASCYRTYTKFYQKKPPAIEGDNEFSKVWELLINLLENPTVEEFKNL